MKSVSIVVRADALTPLDRWLANQLAETLSRPVPRGLARKAILTGLVAVGGAIENNPGRVLTRGRSVFVRRLDWLPPITPEAQLRMLYEDEAVIAVDKPAGLPTHETRDEGRAALTGLVEKYLGLRAFVHHRLDAGTSGVVIFAKAASANASLSRSFAERRVAKTYIALVDRPPVDWPTEITIDSPLKVLANGAVRVDSSGLPAQTLIRVLGRSRDTLLVEAKPVTGRKHQIRVHLASLGAPILGDRRYGNARAGPNARLMLHAESLALDHPTTGEPLLVTSPRPREFRLGNDGNDEPAPGSKGERSGPERPRRSGRPPDAAVRRLPRGGGLP